MDTVILQAAIKAQLANAAMSGMYMLAALVLAGLVLLVSEALKPKSKG